MAVLGWKIYYSDGTVADSNAGAWSAAPRAGVLWVNVYHDTTFEVNTPGGRKTVNFRQMLYSSEFYWEDPAGTFDEAMASPAGVPAAQIKTGIYVSDTNWKTLASIAAADDVWV